MTIVHSFKCEMTGDQCVVLRDKNGDEICLTVYDYNQLYRPTIKGIFKDDTYSAIANN